ncbi:MAG: hypothetical protein E7K04_02835 [Helicobacter sp.]|nr:hypothetical protein [Helicobacter sp.]
MTLLLLHTQNTHFLGLYDKCNLILELQNSSKSLDALCEMYIQANLQDIKISQICYGRGPGALSAQKLIHIFANTIALLKGAKLLATNNFELNCNSPIHAFGNKYFVKNENVISMQTMQPRNEELNTKIALPKKLDLAIFNEALEPLYITDAL